MKYITYSWSPARVQYGPNFLGPAHDLHYTQAHCHAGSWRTEYNLRAKTANLGNIVTFDAPPLK